MATYRAQVSRSIKYAHVAQDGKDGYTVVCSPEAVVFQEGVAQTVNVAIKVYRGAEVVSGWSFTAMNPVILTEGCRVTSLSTIPGYQVRYTKNVFDVLLEFDVTITNGPTIHKAVPIAVAERGLQGVRGVFIPTPREWWSYPSDYVFQSGGAGDERMDVVIDEGSDGSWVAYKCKVNHTKGSQSPTRNTTNWEVYQSQYRLLATDVILAKSGFIGLLSSNAIRIYNASGKCVGMMAGSDAGGGNSIVFFIGGQMADSGVFESQPGFAVDSNGKAYFGGTTGKHIEMNPSAKEMQVFDESGNLCAVHGGSRVEYDKAVPGGSSAGTAENLIEKGSMSFGEQKVSVTKYATSSEKTFGDKPGTVEVVTPAFTVKVKANPSSVSGGGTATFKPQSGIGMAVEFLVGDVVRASGAIGNHYTELNSEQSTTFTSRTFKFPVGANEKYKVRLVATYALSGSGTASNEGKVSFVAEGNITGKVVAQGYSARYVSNGLVLSTDSNNYVYFLFDTSGKLHCKAVSGGKSVFDSNAV